MLVHFDIAYDVSTGWGAAFGESTVVRAHMFVVRVARASLEAENESCKEVVQTLWTRFLKIRHGITQINNDVLPFNTTCDHIV